MKKGDLYWRCKYGHTTTVYLSKIGGASAIGGSSWDMCDWCGEVPTPVDDVRMPLAIFGHWLRNGEIDRDTYQAFALNVVSPMCEICESQDKPRPNYAESASSICAPCRDDLHRMWEDRQLRKKMLC